MIQQAFAGNEKMLKGGLHSHTTRSDGRVTPEEAIRCYYQNGYDFLALTDHGYYNYKSFCPDLPITISPGMEYDITFEEGKGFRAFHTVCLGPSKEDGNGYEQDQIVPSGTASNQEEYQVYLDDIHSKGNLTIYCHPGWSCTPARYFENQKGNIAMEIWNSGSAMDREMDMDAAYWDEILGKGKLIYGVATDDGHRMEQQCNGWVMVRAENNINAILTALKNGAFYSSCGPEIYNFYVEDGKAVVECSPVAKIRFHSDAHPTEIKRAVNNGTINRAELDVENWRGGCDYVRVTIIDQDGKYAWTNPIFLDKRSQEEYANGRFI